MTRVAAYDCGTNSLRLLVADLDGTEQRDVDRRTTIVRLGQDVDRTGRFAPEALARTFATVEDYVAMLDELRPDRVRFVATSAARDASNGQEFIAGVRERVGVDPDIISGDEEARLAYDGATRGLVSLPGARPPYLVVDIGGGSTEFILGAGRAANVDAASFDVEAQSLDIGSVRMTERHLTADPPSPEQVAAAVADIDAAIDRLTVPLDEVGTIVGVAGTVTTMAAMTLGLAEYDREAVHLARLASEDVLAAVDEIVAMTVAERKALGFMDPGRADVIGGGALVVGCVVRRVGLDSLVVSEQDILDGIAWSMA